jgi:2-desacetyl-2-hydroxyethyl bacteriochlorophyllide A dehydrogenase
MSRTMKAAVLKAPGALVVEEVPVQKINADELTIEVAACGICGSDLRYFDGENPWAQHTLGRHEPNPPNMILGHEFAGTVVESGSKALDQWIGKRVVVAPFDVPGYDRATRLGMPHLATDTVHIGHGAGWGEMEYFPGAMARYCRAWARRCYVLPGTLSFDEAAMLDVAGVAYHALEVGGITSGQTVAVVGMGPLGVSAARLARLRGATKVFAIDIYDSARPYAENSDAVFINSRQETDWAAHIKDTTDGWGVDAVIDTIGEQETLASGCRALAPGGTLVMLAVHTGLITLPATDLASERTITSSANYQFDDFQKTLDLAASGALALSDLITHHVTLDAVNDGFQLLRDKERTGALKVVVVP